MSDGYICFVYRDSPDRYFKVDFIRAMMDRQNASDPAEDLIRVEMAHEKEGCTFAMDVAYKFLCDDHSKIKYVEGKELSLRALLVGSKAEPTMKIDWASGYGSAIMRPENNAVAVIA